MAEVVPPVVLSEAHRMRIRDEEGRPLLESRAPEALRRGVEFEVKPCRYAGSRFKNARPMNVSALAQMTRHWDEVTAGLAHLRVLLAGGDGARAEFALGDVWRTAVMATLLADYLALRSRAPLGDVLPAPIAALVKVAAGIVPALTDLLVFPDDDADTAVLEVDEHTLYDFVESEGMFVGDGEVCAGPEPMVKEVLALLVRGHDPPRPPPPAFVAVFAPGEAARFREFAQWRADAMLLTRWFFVLAHRAWPSPPQAAMSDRDARTLGVDHARLGTRLLGLLAAARDATRPDVSALLTPLARPTDAWAPALSPPDAALLVAALHARGVDPGAVDAVVPSVRGYVALEAVYSRVTALVRRAAGAALGLDPTSPTLANPDHGQSRGPPFGELRARLGESLGLGLEIHAGDVRLVRPPPPAG